MNSNESKNLINDYYEIAYLFGDNIECIADFICDNGLTSMSKNSLIDNMENLRLGNMIKEFDKVLDMKTNSIKSYVEFWKLIRGIDG